MRIQVLRTWQGATSFFRKVVRRTDTSHQTNEILSILIFLGSKAHGGSGDGRTKYVPLAKSKRQHIDEDEGSCDAPTSSAKKQRTRNLELPRKDGGYFQNL